MSKVPNPRFVGKGDDFQIVELALDDGELIDNDPSDVDEEESDVEEA